jgi:HEPN domain-containing protein
MDEAKRELVQTWLIIAQHDLAAARKLSADPDPYLDTAIYHCQQAAEKAVKGFLVFHDKEFEKTHSIPLLISLVLPYDSAFAAWQDTAEHLTPFAVEFRYPGEKMEPDKAEFDRALQGAQDLYTFVLSKLPGEVHP